MKVRERFKLWRGKRAERRQARRQAARADPDRVEWPPLRTDVFVLFAAGLVIWSGIDGQWGFAAYALSICTFAVVFPRMYGRYGVGGPEGPLQGVVTPSRSAQEAGLAPTPPPAPSQQPPLPQPAAEQATKVQPKRSDSD